MVFLLAGSALLLAQTPQVQGAGSKDDLLLAAMFNTPIEAASKRHQSLMDSPQAIEVLTAEQIRSSGVFRLVDVLKLMTSVQVYEFNKDYSKLSIRGTMVNGVAKNVQLLVDGVPLFNPEANSGVNFSSIPIPVEAIERVEVVRGPSSSLYGANAQAGVISITTRKAVEGSALSLRVSAAGSATTNSQGFFSYGSPRFNLAVGFGGDSQRDSGFSDRELGGTRRVELQDQNHGSQVFLRPEVMLSGGRVWGMYSQDYSQWAPQVVETTAGVNLYQYANSHTATEVAQVGWSQTWSPVFRTELKVNRAHLKPYSIPPMGVIPGSPASAATVAFLQNLDPGLKSNYDLLDTTTEQLLLQVNWDPSNLLHVVFGFDSARMKVAKTPILGIHEDREDSATGGFLSLDWALDRTTFSLGARIENETLGGSRISPRMTISQSLPDASILRVGYYTSTRSPMVGEVVQDIRLPGRPAPIGNPDIQPEVFHSIEIGYRKNWSMWSVDATAYQMTLNKIIEPEPTGRIVGGFSQTQFQNSRSLTNRGVEVSLKGELRAGWRLGFNATTVDFKDDTGTQESYSPKLTANLWTRYNAQRFRAYLALQQVGAYLLTNPANPTGPSENAPSRLQVHFNLGFDVGSGFQVSLYGINAARPYDESTAGKANNGHLIGFSRREVGFQASWRY